MTSNSKFWETAGCLNLQRPSGLKEDTKANSLKLAPKRYKYLDEVNVKIDLENMGAPEYENSKYVLTSPRSLEACAQLKIKPLELLPKSLADIQDEIGGEKVPLRIIYQVYDEYEVERKEKLQRAKSERLKIMNIANAPRSTELSQQHTLSSSNFQTVSDVAMDKTLNKLNQLKELITKHKELSDELYRQDRPFTAADAEELNQSLKNKKIETRNRPTSATNFELKNTTNMSNTNNNQIENKKEKLAEFERFVSELDEAEQLKLIPYLKNKIESKKNKNTSSALKEFNPNLSRSLENLNSNRKTEAMQQLYAKNLDKLKERTESHLYATSLSRTVPTPKPVLDTSFKRQQQLKTIPLVYNENTQIIQNDDLVKSHFEREAKLAKTLLNAKKIEEETENYRKKKLMNEILHINKASEQREKHLREKSNRVFGNRRIRERLHEDNYEKLKQEEMLKKLLNLTKMQHKETVSSDFVKRREYSKNLTRSLAKSSHDLRELYKDKSMTFDKMVKQAEQSNLIGRGFHKGAKNESSVFIT